MDTLWRANQIIKDNTDAPIKNIMPSRRQCRCNCPLLGSQVSGRGMKGKKFSILNHMSCLANNSCKSFLNWVFFLIQEVKKPSVSMPLLA